jgi:hypothetical protein
MPIASASSYCPLQQQSADCLIVLSHLCIGKAELYGTERSRASFVLQWNRYVSCCYAFHSANQLMDFVRFLEQTWRAIRFMSIRLSVSRRILPKLLGRFRKRKLPLLLLRYFNCWFSVDNSSPGKPIFFSPRPPDPLWAVSYTMGTGGYFFEDKEDGA